MAFATAAISIWWLLCLTTGAVLLLIGYLGRRFLPLKPLFVALIVLGWLSAAPPLLLVCFLIYRAVRSPLPGWAQVPFDLVVLFFVLMLFWYLVLRFFVSRHERYLIRRQAYRETRAQAGGRRWTPLLFPIIAAAVNLAVLMVLLAIRPTSIPHGWEGRLPLYLLCGLVPLNLSDLFYTVNRRYIREAVLLLVVALVLAGVSVLRYLYLIAAWISAF